MLLKVDWGEGNVSTGGNVNELLVKTEWKYVLSKLALSQCEVTFEDSNVIGGGRDPWPLTFLIYLKILELSFCEVLWISLASNKVFAAVSLCCKSDSSAVSLERILGVGWCWYFLLRVWRQFRRCLISESNHLGQFWFLHEFHYWNVQMDTIKNQVLDDGPNMFYTFGKKTDRKVRIKQILQKAIKICFREVEYV